MKKNYSTARELRAQAKDRLKHRWGIAMIAFLIAFVLGAVGNSLSTTITEGIFAVNWDGETVETVSLEDLEAPDEAASVDDFMYETDDYMMDDDHSEYLQDMIEDFTMTVAILFVIILVVVVYCFLYALFGVAPLKTGYMRFNLDLFKTRREVSLNRLLYGFRNGYFRSVGVCFGLGLIYIGVALCFLSIPVLLIVLGWGRWLSDIVSLLVWAVFLVGMLAWTVANIKVALTYSMCYYLLADHPEMTGREALKTSKAMMNGHKWRLLRLRLSFLGWVFLSFFTFGIGLLWVGPYMQAADAAFYRELARGGKKQSFFEGLFQGF